jgi:hypothetical protein
MTKQTPDMIARSPQSKRDSPLDYDHAILSNLIFKGSLKIDPPFRL